MYMWYGKAQINTPFVHSLISVCVLNNAPLGYKLVSIKGMDKLIYL